jgi:uncharacterized membrane protein YbhN (UPF0104 family)
MRKYFFNGLVYLSLVFLVVFLYRYNYIDVKGLRFNPFYLTGAIIFLWLGFFGSTLGWKKALLIHGVSISTRQAIVSHGLSVFAKFIPGKVWVILGRASKATLQGQSIRTASFASLKEQLVYVWLGLLQALIVFFVSHRNFELLLLILVLLAGLTLFNFSDWFRRISAYLFQKIFKKELDIPRVTPKELLQLIGYIALYWLCWDIAFWLFVKSIFPEAPILAAFVFPLSVTLGLLAIIVPGGLGVREGLIILGLSVYGIPVELATTISIASRLWYTTGELFIFVLALILDHVKRKSNPTN